MEWLFVGGLGIIWAAFLYSPKDRRASPRTSVQEFERNMGLLAETERAPGRWIVAPRKGTRFMGDSERNRRRARERRRRLFLALLEATCLTFLIGVFPPLRGMWVLTASLAGLLVVYVCALLKIKQLERSLPARPAAGAADPNADRAPSPLLAQPRDAWFELDELVHVVVRPARELQAAGA